MFSRQCLAGRGLLSVLAILALLSLVVGRLAAEENAGKEMENVAVDDTDSESPDAQPADTKSADGETYDLSTQAAYNAATRVTIELEVGGDLKVAAEPGKGTAVVRKLPMSVVADIAYEERVLEEQRPRATSPEQATPAIPTRRSVRYYERAGAVIKVDQGGVDEELADDRRLVIARTVDTEGRAGNRIILTSPNGMLTREQLDLIDIIGSSLVLPDLMPTQPIAIGESWRHTEAAIAALVRLEAVSYCDVQSTLVSVEDDQATISLAGPVSGATEGVASEIELKANYRVDLSSRRITQFNLAVQEKRPVGHSSPGVDLVANLKMRVAPLAKPQHLTAEVVAPLRLPSISQATRSKDAAPATRLFHSLAGNRWRLAHDRRWYVTADTERLSVLRMIDRGDLIAQCNIRPLADKSPERHVTLGQFQKEVRFALNDRFEKLVSAAQWESEAGHRVFRVVAHGKVDELPIEWRSYLVAHRDGPRLNVSFTVEGPLAERLGKSDRDLIASLDYIESEPPAEADESETATASDATESAGPSTEQADDAGINDTPTATNPAATDNTVATDKAPAQDKTEAKKPTTKKPVAKKPVTTAERTKRGRSIRLRR